MFSMAVTLAIITVVLEFMLVKRYPPLYDRSVDNPLVSVCTSLALSVALSYLFGAGGLIVLLASAMSITGSWSIYRLVSLKKYLLRKAV